MTDKWMNMPEDPIDPIDPWAKTPVNRPATSSAAGAPAAGASDPRTAAQKPGAAAKRSRGRRIARWASWLLIAAGILIIPAYYGGTCAYTAILQRGLRADLAAANPQMAATQATLTDEDFQQMELTKEQAAVASAAAADKAAAEAALQAAEAERMAELEAFRTASVAYALTVLPGKPIGRIVIPKIGVDVVMVEGTGKPFLKVGPGHWPETPFPGQVGNFVVSGHRTTYGAPFFKLNELEPGDEIQLILPYAVCKYTVTRVVIVAPDEVEAVKQQGHEQVSLAACHPIYSAKQRIVAQGDLTSFVLVDQAGASD
jgi:LPXTG-site transpeptidase (sortase) family protein